jgi:hypothetical protein
MKKISGFITVYVFFVLLTGCNINGGDSLNEKQDELITAAGKPVEGEL